MPKKKVGGGSVLGLPSLPPSPGSTHTSVMPQKDSSVMRSYELQIAEELYKQELLIAGTKHKATFAIEQMNETKSFAVSDIWFTMQEFEEIKQEAVGTSQQDVMEELTSYMTRLVARHTLGVVEVSAGKIAEVVSYSIEPPPPPLPVVEKPKGLLARLFGG